MKLATIQLAEQEQAAFLTEQGFVSIQSVNETEGTHWNSEIWTLLQSGQMAELQQWYIDGGKDRIQMLPALSEQEISCKALYRKPGKIIGIGMNYLAKAIELSGRPPEDEPVIFLKPDTSLIGPGEKINLPAGMGQISAEAELSIIIGKTCRNISEEEAMNAAAGFTTSLDMTAKDIHARNPRFMQRAKSFDTFLSIGSSLSTPDEYDDLSQLAVETVLNGTSMHVNTVSRMIFSPAYLISFLSHIMTLNPGDIILTGTPGSVLIQPADEVECRIQGLLSLHNPVSE